MKIAVAAVVALFLSLTAPAAAESERITKPAYAQWDSATVAVYVDPSARRSGWTLPRAIRAWSAGPVRLEVVSSPAAASITISEIPRHPNYWGNARHTTLDGWMLACHVTLTDATRPKMRAHVAAHEIGHCLGLPHVSEYHSVMDVWYRGDHRGPSSLDLEWLRSVYAN